MSKTIAVVCAMKSEAQPLLDRLSDLKEESCHNFEINRGTLGENT